VARVFIDGHVGTTGLEIFSRLEQRSDVQLIRLAEDVRKDPSARSEALTRADVAILCLPDDAARETVQLARQAGAQTRFLDASTAHRTASDWTYGLPELDADQRDAIATARYVSNPGCYPQGFILCVRPLIRAGLLPADTHLSVHALSGYSGGGRSMIEAYQCDGADRQAWGARPYGLTLAHKHLPEMHLYSSAAHAPVFSPAVAFYYKGLITQVPLPVAALSGGATDVHAVLAHTYAGEPFIRVLEPGAASALDGNYLSPTALNGTNFMEIMVFGNDEQILLTARYDNLGKGAAGAAVQNLNLMLGVDETTGLV
jgi:N-acetyl-gamma-glutamyl-phosphate reductase|tara:strand:- start:3582 stop:4526 length:945 start_codon:yes stop_codon:yes gene_type:complete